ncbi:crAss001_48 related protein [Ottowia sp. VDI28]|uniref:crAss001_48 related protein n=1 Tax=Ottowia sp. VDI28 TaxID=3133968 RepID=UPI003C2AEBE5
MNSPTIKPTVGRVVWFYPSQLTGESGFARASDGQPLAAIIARVWSDTCLNLTVLDADGVPHSRTSVLLVQDPDAADRPAGNYCTWMPFQKGQAAKAETAEKTATSKEYRQSTRREQLEYALVSGAASRVADEPSKAGAIANGIMCVLAAMCPSELVASSPAPGANLPPHQQRVVAEKAENDDRVAKLCAFILDNPIFPTLPVKEQGRLQAQAELMGQLSDILGQRITAFSAEVAREAAPATS